MTINSAETIKLLKDSVTRSGIICLLYLCVQLETPDSFRNRTVATRSANLCQVYEGKAKAAPRHGSSVIRNGVRYNSRPAFYQNRNKIRHWNNIYIDISELQGTVFPNKHRR
jgi:IS30 family transposase